MRLDDGAYIRNNLMFQANGSALPLDKPNQLLMRWYGFALTFPKCEIGQAA